MAPTSQQLKMRNQNWEGREFWEVETAAMEWSLEVCHNKQRLMQITMLLAMILGLSRP